MIQRIAGKFVVSVGFRTEEHARMFMGMARSEGVVVSPTGARVPITIVDHEANRKVRDVTDRPWQTCSLCNYDLHVCGGCGEPVSHSQGRCCDDCASGEEVKP